MTAAMAGDYPMQWSDFVGQDAAKRQLRIAAGSAKLRGDQMPHVMLKSPYSGIGKTSLALLTAGELGTKVVPVSGVVTIDDARMLFLDMNDGDVLFYDEVHRAVDSGKKHIEWMLNWLHDGVLLTPAGMSITPKVTMIAATTDAGRLPRPLLERFKLQPVLDPYTDVQASQIVGIMQKKALVDCGLPPVSDLVAARIARAASNRPRWMRRVLESLRDLVVMQEVKAPDNGDYDLTEALEFIGVTEDGLTSEAQRYMYVLFRELHGKPAGAQLLKERLGEVGTGLGEIEQLLMDKGFIVKTKAGRVLTDPGLQRGKELAHALDVAV